MKQTSSPPNEGIDDNNVAYTTKMEGYATFMSYMNELSEMPEPAFKDEKEVENRCIKKL
jgi:hypothetical protein